MGLYDEGVKKGLEETLKEHLKGVQRVPSLLINEQDKSMEGVNLGMKKFSMEIQHIYLTLKPGVALKKKEDYM